MVIKLWNVYNLRNFVREMENEQEFNHAKYFGVIKLPDEIGPNSYSHTL